MTATASNGRSQFTTSSPKSLDNKREEDTGRQRIMAGPIAIVIVCMLRCQEIRKGILGG